MTDNAAIPWRELLHEDLKDPEFRGAWERAALARAVGSRLIAYRIEHWISQTGLGNLLGMKQSAIARLERSEHTPTLETMLRLADVLGMEFLVHVAPKGQPTTWQDPRVEEGATVEQIESPARGSVAVVGVR